VFVEGNKVAEINNSIMFRCESNCSAFCEVYYILLDRITENFPKN